MYLVKDEGVGESDYINDVFGPLGLLAQKFDGYAPRAGQIALAFAVDAAIRDGANLMAEGPTGTGKSLAYAVPAAYHVNRPGGVSRVVIATANIALQEQLVGKDLPLLKQLLPWEFSFSLLKGKGNYLCMDLFRRGGGPDNSRDDADAESNDEMRRAILEWGRTTTTGDASELPFLPPPQLWQRFSVSADDCKGKTCPAYADCHAERAHVEAIRASIIVTNYHMLFAHAKLRAKTGKDLVLPAFGAVILDEGHEAADIAREFFGFRVTEGMVRHLARFLTSSSEHNKLHSLVFRQAKQFFADLLELKKSKKYKVRLKSENLVEWRPLCDSILIIGAVYGEEHDSSSDVNERNELERAVERAKELATQIKEAMTLSDPNSVYFIEEDEQKERATLCAKPIDVAEMLQSKLFNLAKSATLTSATLSTATSEAAHSFAFVERETGIPSPRTLVAASPFQWEKQVLLVVPRGMPDPNAPAFMAAVTHAVSETIGLATGRTLALFTSYKMLDATYQRISGGPHRVLKQRQMPRTTLLDEFKRDTASVLLGTDSFWMGVDVPGESLSCVIIDRLPFQRPSDPVLDALMERSNKTFMGYSIPRAIIMFKQGFGRLIRTVSDRGVVVVLDRRIVHENYGALFIKSLPNVQKSRDLEDVRRFLASAPRT